MSDTSLGSLGHWLHRRAIRAATRLEDAKHKLEDCGVAIADLRQSWDEQVKAQSKPLPSMYVCINQWMNNDLIAPNLSVASKNLAGAFVTNLLSMIESQSNTQGSIKRILTEMASLGQDAQSAERRVDLSIQQSDLEASNQRLSIRITKGVKQLMDKDRATAAVLKRAQDDEFISLRLRARALKHRIRCRIRERRFESERLERAYFRATLGTFQ